MPANVTALRAAAAAEEFVTVVPHRQMMIFHAFLHTHDAKASPNRHQQRRGREESDGETDTQVNLVAFLEYRNVKNTEFLLCCSFVSRWLKTKNIK